MSTISEVQLVLPSLFLMSLTPNGQITTTELKIRLTELMKPTGEDAAQLQNRPAGDIKFHQKVRNLNSHDTLLKLGYANYIKTGHNKGYFEITAAGLQFLNDNIDIVKYLLSNDFSFNDLNESFTDVFKGKAEERNVLVFDENVLINEGTYKLSTSKKYERSSKLRDMAIEHYTQGGRIVCKACCFDFEKFYGKHGKGFIEIHHQKPVFMFEDNEFEQTLNDALKNVLPVCANCHRIIHRKKNKPLIITELQSIISKDLSFCEPQKSN